MDRLRQGVARLRPIPAGLVINHKNGRKDDNRPENLEAVSESENHRHAHRMGLIDQRGERNPAATLTDGQVQAIRWRRARGESLKAIAGDYGVTFQCVSKIARGATRRTAGGPLTARDGRKDGWRRLARGSDGQFAGRLLDGREWSEVPHVD